MTIATAPKITLTPEELDKRRLAVQNTIGTMRIEDMEPDEATMRILDRYTNGEIDFPEANRLMLEDSRTII
jgi:hypothetical protein